MTKRPKATENLAKNVETKSVRKELEQKLGQLTYKIGKKQDEARKINTELQGLQVEANGVATQIEKFERAE